MNEENSFHYEEWPKGVRPDTWLEVLSKDCRFAFNAQDLRNLVHWIETYKQEAVEAAWERGYKAGKEFEKKVSA